MIWIVLIVWLIVGWYLNYTGYLDKVDHFLWVVIVGPSAWIIMIFAIFSIIREVLWDMKCRK